MPTIADYQAVLLREVGAGLDGLPDPVRAAVLDQVTPFMASYWEMNRRHGLVWPELQYLYTKRMCLDVLLGQNRDRITVSVGGTSVPQQQILDNLETIRKTVVDEIARLEARAQASRPPALAAMASSTQMDSTGRLYNPLSPTAPVNRRAGNP